MSRDVIDYELCLARLEAVCTSSNKTKKERESEGTAGVVRSGATNPGGIRALALMHRRLSLMGRLALHGADGCL